MIVVDSNTHLPGVMRLPAEVLEEIFSYVDDKAAEYFAENAGILKKYSGNLN